MSDEFRVWITVHDATGRLSDDITLDESFVVTARTTGRELKQRIQEYLEEREDNSVFVPTSEMTLYHLRGLDEFKDDQPFGEAMRQRYFRGPDSEMRLVLRDNSHPFSVNVRLRDAYRPGQEFAIGQFTINQYTTLADLVHEVTPSLQQPNWPITKASLSVSTSNGHLLSYANTPLADQGVSAGATLVFFRNFAAPHAMARAMQAAAGY